MASELEEAGLVQWKDGEDTVTAVIGSRAHVLHERASESTELAVEPKEPERKADLKPDVLVKPPVVPKP